MFLICVPSVSYTQLLENEYTNYFTVQKSLSELIEDGFVFLNVNRNTSYYHLTSEGRESLKFFENKIPNPIVDDVDMFLSIIHI